VRLAARLTLSIGLAGCFASGCTAAEYNGRHYHASKSVLGIPVELSRRDLPELAGELFAECGPTIVPIGERRIVLERAGSVVMETTTDPSGHFAMSGDLPSGVYQLRVADPVLVGFETVTIRGYDVPRIRLLARCHS
jgi:hypothetical protein